LAKPLDPAPAPTAHDHPTRSSWARFAWLGIVLAGLAVIYTPGLGNLPVFDDTYFTDGAVASRYATVQATPRMLAYG
jgi:hypothetical protein